MNIPAFDHSAPRPLSLALLIAILTLGPLSVWLLFRRGYSRDLRIGAITYVLLGPAVSLIAALGEISSRDAYGF